MAGIDVSEVLTDPDFINKFQYIRSNQTIDDTDGVATNVPQAIQNAWGCVTNDQGDLMIRSPPEGEYNTGTILIHTKTQLISGENGQTADVVIFWGKRYTVKSVVAYGHFGEGFSAASCDLIPYGGGTSQPSLV